MQGSIAIKYPPIFALAGVIAGIVLANAIAISSWLLLLFALASLFGAVSLHYKHQLLASGIAGIFCLLFLSAFNFSFNYRTFPPGHIAKMADDGIRYVVFGQIDDWPELKYQKTDIVISVDSVKAEGKMQRAQGRLLVSIGTETTRLQYGDRIFFESRIYSLHGGKTLSGYDRRRRLNLQGIFGAAYLPHQFSLQIDPTGPANYNRLIGQLRSGITDIFRQTLDSNSAALAGGFLIGETRDIPPDIYRLFRDSGTLHLLAVSGSNVALVILMFALVMKGAPFRKGMQILILLLIIIIFSSLAYNQPSVVRAALMASLLLIGKFLQRRIDYNNIIAAAALIILIFKPGDLFDIGFQLSFATAWGLIILLPITSRFLGDLLHHRYLKFIIWPIAISVIAQLVSLPLTAFYFHRFPLISFAANLVIVPLVSLATVGEIILLLLASILPVLGNMFGSWLNPVFKATIYFLQLFVSSGPTIQSGLPFLGGTLFLYYSVFFFGAAAITSKWARRWLIIAVLIGGNWILFSNLFAEKKNILMTIVPFSGGIIAINHSNPPQIILSDLPESEYDIMESEIIPSLEKNKNQKVEAVALSSDHPTLSAAHSLIAHDIVSNVYIPLEGARLFADICTMAGNKSGTPVKYYGQLTVGDSMAENSMAVSNDQAIWRWNRSTIMIANKSFHSVPIANSAIDVLLKPQIGIKDIHQFQSWPIPLPQLIITHNLTAEAEKEISNICRNSNRPLPKLVILSQSGVIELVIRDGRLDIAE
jgi:ComEC/Rec2-related protein